MMKTRLVVMNGQRVLQAEEAGQWVNERIQKAGIGVDAGIYDLYLSVELPVGQVGSGIIIHTDKNHIYQYDGKKIIKYDKNNFSQKLTVGDTPSISRLEAGSYEVN